MSGPADRDPVLAGTAAPDGVELSVILAVKDSAGTITAQLEALVGQSWSAPWELIIADNGSKDGTRSIAEEYAARHPNIRIVDASDVSGAGPARNAAMRAADGRAFAFCDGDDVVGPGWIAAIGGALRHQDAVTGPVAFDALNEEWLRTAFYTRPPSGPETFEGIFPFGATCNLGVSRAAIERVGGFDPSFATGQDIELCLRLWHAGIELAFVPEATVQYRYRPSLRALFRRSRQYGAVGPRIARRLDSIGAENPPRLGGLRNALWLARHIGRLRTRAGRARWMVVAGRLIGRIQGSATERRLYV